MSSFWSFVYGEMNAFDSLKALKIWSIYDVPSSHKLFKLLLKLKINIGWRDVPCKNITTAPFRNLRWIVFYCCTWLCFLFLFAEGKFTLISITEIWMIVYIVKINKKCYLLFHSKCNFIIITSCSDFFINFEFL